MQRSWPLCVILIAAIGSASCSRDPDAEKRKYLESGNRYLAEKKYQEAILEYRNALQQDAKFGDARLKLTDAYLGAGDLRNALGEAVRAADVLPDNVDAQLRAGTLLLGAKQFPEAKERAAAALKRDPKNTQALILLGNALAGLRDIDGAIQQIEQAIGQDPQLTITYTNLADLYAAKGDKPAAERAFQNAVKAAPNSVDPHLGYANFLWAQQRWPEAERELKAAAAIEPKSIMVNRSLAAFYASQNRSSEAVTYLETYVTAIGTVEARLLLADYNVGLKNIARARELLNELAKDPRGLSPATARLSLLDFREGHRTDAYERLERVLAKDSKDLLALQGKARLLLAEGRGQEALRVTELLMTVNASLPSTMYLHGMALEETGLLEDATAAYLDLLKTDPSSPPVKERLAIVYLRRQDPKDALGYAEQFLRAQPQSPSAALVYAQALLQTGDFARAETELLALAKFAPSSSDVFAWLGRLYEAKHDATRARQSYQKALDLQPTSLMALTGLTSVDVSEKQPAVAVARIESQLSVHPNDPNLLLLHALALFTTQDLPRAEAAYRKVLEVAPDNLEAYGRLAAIYMAQNRLDDAKTQYEVVLKRQPQSAAAETMLGTILTQQNNAAEARRHFERAIEIQPRNVVASNNLAWDYANNGGNLDVALQLAQVAKAGAPDSATVTDTLGWVYYKKGLSSLATTTLRQAAALDTKNANVQYHLGLALIQQGDKVQARKALDQAVRLNPTLASDDGLKRALASVTAS